MSLLTDHFPTILGSVGAGASDASACSASVRAADALTWASIQFAFVYLQDERVDIALLEAAQILDFQSGADVLYVFHGMPMTADQKRQYRKLKGR